MLIEFTMRSYNVQTFDYVFVFFIYYIFLLGFSLKYEYRYCSNSLFRQNIIQVRNKSEYSSVCIALNILKGERMERTQHTFKLTIHKKFINEHTNGLVTPFFFLLPKELVLKTVFKPFRNGFNSIQLLIFTLKSGLTKTSSVLIRNSQSTGFTFTKDRKGLAKCKIWRVKLAKIN